VKDLYNENYKIMKGDTRKWKDFTCLSIGGINTIKMAKLLKEIYRYNVIPIKISMSFFIKIEKAHKIHIEA
jgi:hypothetical protein